MKILYNHRTRASGVEGVHIRGVVDALRGLEHKVILVSLPGTEHKQIPFNFLLERIWNFVSLNTPEIIFEMLEIAYNVVSFMRLSVTIYKQKIDFIYERYALFNFAGIMISRLFRIPIILEINDISTLDRVRKLRMKGIAKWLEDKILKKANALVTISKYFKDYLIERGFNSSKIWITPNAVDPDIFNPERCNNVDVGGKFGFNGKVVIGFVGRFERWHGIEFLLLSVADLYRNRKDIALFLVGGDYEKEKKYLKEIIEKEGIKDAVTFSGWVNHKDIPTYIAAMDICVMPDSNNYGSPMKIFEYMAMAKPVVAPRLGPIKDIIMHNHNGVMFEPGDKESLKKALLDLLGDDKKRSAIGSEASKTVLKRHTWKNNAEKIINIFESVRDNWI